MDAVSAVPNQRIDTFWGKKNEIWRWCHQSLEATDSLRSVRVTFSFFVHEGKEVKDPRAKKYFKLLYALL